MSLSGALDRMKSDMKRQEDIPKYGDITDVVKYCKSNGINVDIAIDWFINMYQDEYMKSSQSQLRLCWWLSSMEKRYGISEEDIEKFMKIISTEVDKGMIKAFTQWEEIKTGERKIAYKEWLKPDVVKKKYEELGSMAKVARHFNVNVGTIRSRLKEWETAHKK